MEINLLPKESPTRKYRLLAIIAAVVLLFGGAGTSLFYYIHLLNTTDDLTAELRRVKQDNVTLTAERTVDSQTKKYNQVKGAVDNLISEQNDYGQMLDGLASKLSDRTQIEQVSVDTANGTVHLNLHTDDATRIEEYAALLRSEVWVEEILVENIQQIVTDTTATGGVQTPDSGGFSAKLTITLKPRRAQES
ncbi:hypothetical protein JJB07_10415 [Tumebacillus sp. ITR2]|uniref:Fimbrial assembly protein n=1 Tax=Tumebacillus amylolyticus TaxID=2801339 RepID=A0ABS1JAK1_9BACL|nr:hypothetical protein [Tumebacillus amylolyticus]MBL0387064.1 hypothetical protein [Tumebacillus amylolyticus]